MIFMHNGIPLGDIWSSRSNCVNLSRKNRGRMNSMNGRNGNNRVDGCVVYSLEEEGAVVEMMIK